MSITRTDSSPSTTNGITLPHKQLADSSLPINTPTMACEVMTQERVIFRATSPLKQLPTRSADPLTISCTELLDHENASQ